MSDAQGNLLFLGKGLDLVHGRGSVCLAGSRDVMDIVDDNGCRHDLVVLVVDRMVHNCQIQPEVSQGSPSGRPAPVSYTHLRAHETRHDLVCRLLLEKKKKIKQ